jgi:hypothetical protein
MTKRLMLGILALGALALLPSPAQAQVTAGKLRIGLDTRLLGFAAVTRELDDSPHTELKYRTFDFGLAAPEVGATVGYTVIDGLVVGGRIALSFAGTKIDPEQGDDDRNRVFGLRILPYAEYGFNLGRIVPFVTATLGYRCDLVKYIAAYDEDNEAYDKVVTNLFVMGAGGGAHFFIVEQLSFDATLMAFGDFGMMTEEVGNDDGDTNTDYKWRAFEMSLLIGMSGWI